MFTKKNSHYNVLYVKCQTYSISWVSTSIDIRNHNNNSSQSDNEHSPSERQNKKIAKQLSIMRKFSSRCLPTNAYTVLAQNISDIRCWLITILKLHIYITYQVSTYIHKFLNFYFLWKGDAMFQKKFFFNWDSKAVKNVVVKPSQIYV